MLACAFALSLPAAAQDVAANDWRGPYIGVHAGGALGLVDVEDPFGSSIFGDTVRTPGLLGGGQAGYNWQHGATVYGLEADVSLADMDGTNTCFAYSGFYVSANCAAHIDALATLAGRIGWTLPFDAATLLYAKGGLALEYSRVKGTTNDAAGTPTTTADGVRAGWMLGAGAERAVSSRWTLKGEYAFLSFGGDSFSSPVGFFQPAPSVTTDNLIAGSAGTHIDQQIHQFKLGLNYRLGVPSGADDRFLPPGPVPGPAGVELEAGFRYVYGWGQFEKDLGTAVPNIGLASLASRLTYDAESNGGEFFARLDGPYDFVVMGFVGAGTGGGSLNDEDWGLPSPPFPAFVPYSNTYSDVDNRINYAVVDLGYDWWRGPDFRLTPFVGYSYLEQRLKGYGCSQIANPNSDCVTPIPTGVLGITEYDTWQALRLGAAADFPLGHRFGLALDAAYLPYVDFSGTDNHVLRTLLSPEDGHGTGVQLEGIVTYALTDALSVGIGGRYWAMWTPDGVVDFGGSGVMVPMRYSVEQAQLLVQGSYKFDVAP
jgi:opacity protein-like surface antigen